MVLWRKWHETSWAKVWLWWQFSRWSLYSVRDNRSAFCEWTVINSGMRVNRRVIELKCSAPHRWAFLNHSVLARQGSEISRCIIRLSFFSGLQSAAVQVRGITRGSGSLISCVSVDMNGMAKIIETLVIFHITINCSLHNHQSCVSASQSIATSMKGEDIDLGRILFFFWLRAHN